VVQDESNKIYLVIFGHSYKFLRILEVCTIFYDLKQFKITAQCWDKNRPMATVLGRAAAWSPRAVRAWDGVVARSPAARWRLAGGKILG
jgi:hypothetical protein